MKTVREAWVAPPTREASDADRAAVEACVRDYFGGWFKGDSEQMARALHPALAKRSVGQGVDRAPIVDDTTAQEMIEATAAGWGVARADDQLEIHIAEIGAGMASVIASTAYYVEYLHLVETSDGWRIINALWRWAEGHGPRA
jgi:hypothetical protein